MSTTSSGQKRDSGPFPLADAAGGDPAVDDFALAWISARTGCCERRQVVVLVGGFSDARDGFETVDPEDIAQAQTSRVGRIAEIVERYGGAILAREFDRLIACWGWPVSRSDDACRAVAAALEIRDRFEGLVRCGLDVGIAVTGLVDATSRVVGAVVRRASDLQEAARTAEVLVSPGLQAFVQHAYACMPRAILTPCGGAREQPCAAIEPVDRMRSQTSLSSVYAIGRDSELSMLLDCLRRANETGLACILVHGETGIGKSTLVGMLKRHLSDAGAGLIEVACHQETSPALSAPELQLMQGLDLCRGPSVEQGEPPAPLVVIVEDLHWAARGTLDALARFAGELRPVGAGGAVQPVLLVATSRGCLPVELDRTGPWQTLRLGRMSRAQMHQMLADLPTDEGNGLPVSICDQIVELAEGVPLYALELARIQTAERGSAADHRILARPNRLNATIASCLDALGSLKPLAQAASVLGRAFDAQSLAVVLELDVRVLVARLDLLVLRGALVKAERKVGAGANSQQDDYRFAHALLWSVAYGSMLKSDRRRLHNKAAGDLVACFPGLAALQPAVIAHHHTKAGNWKPAFEWSYRAAVKAAESGIAPDAIAHINQALAAKAAASEPCSPLQEAALMNLLGSQLSVLGGSVTPQVEQAYVRAIDLLSQLPTSPGDLAFDVQWGIAAITLLRGDFAGALRISAQLIDEAREANRDDLLLVALRVNGTANLLAGRVSAAVEMFRAVTALYDAKRHSQLRFRFVSDQGVIGSAHLAWATAISGDVQASLDAERQALRQAEAVGHAHTSASVLGALSVAAQIRGDLPVCAAFARASHEIAREHGFEYWMARAGLLLGLDAARRTPREACAVMASANERYRKTGSIRAAAYGDYIEAEIALEAGEPRRTLAVVARAQANGNLQSNRLFAAELLRLRALAFVACDPAASVAAGEVLREAEAMATAQGALAFARRSKDARKALARRAKPQVLRPG